MNSRGQMISVHRQLFFHIIYPDVAFPSFRYENNGGICLLFLLLCCIMLNHFVAPSTKQPKR